jgi:hypothetical protein
MRFRCALDIVRQLRTLSNDRRKQICLELEKRIPVPQSQLRGKILTWQQVQAMQNEGVTFGSHTISHPVVSRLAETELQRELADSKRMLEEKLGQSVTNFAFPFGQPADCGSDAPSLLPNMGYKSGVTTVSGFNTSTTNPFTLRRVQVDEQYNLAQFALLLSRHLLCSDSGQHEEILSDPSKVESAPQLVLSSTAGEVRNA